MEKKLHDLVPKQPIGMKEALLFSSANEIVVSEKNQNHACCIDGRTSKERAEQSPLAKPGGDIGDLMEAVAAARKLCLQLDNLGYGSIFDAVVKTVGGEENFYFHTDQHPVSLEQIDREDFKSGCGHFTLAFHNPEAYGLTKEDIQAIASFLLKLQTRRQVEILQGRHQERAVLFVESDKWSIAQNGEVFVVQTSLWEKRRTSLSANMAQLDLFKHASIDSTQIQNSLREAANIQASYSLSQLAKGLPIYLVKEGPGGHLNQVTFMHREVKPV